MRLLSDDEVYAVDNIWLGPRGNTLPWRARYAAYAVGFGVFVALLFVERQTRIPVTPWTAVYNLMATILITRTLMRFVDHERPVRTLVATFVHEVGAPRPVRRGARVALAPRRVRVVTSRRATATPAVAALSSTAPVSAPAAGAAGGPPRRAALPVRVLSQPMWATPQPPPGLPDGSRLPLPRTADQSGRRWLRRRAARRDRSSGPRPPA